MKAIKLQLNAAYRNKGTTLSSHIWKLKDKNINFNLKFSILKLSRSYSKEAKVCDLCLTEKMYIMFHNVYLSSDHTDHYSSLNKRSEILQNIGTGPKHCWKIGHKQQEAIAFLQNSSIW